MAVTFPPSPTTGETVTDSTTGAMWTWDGTKWVHGPGTSGGPPYEGPIIGVTDGSNAAPGMVGEYITDQANGVVISTSGLATTLVTIDLTPGDWDIQASVRFMTTGATLMSAHWNLFPSNATSGSMSPPDGGWMGNASGTPLGNGGTVHAFNRYSITVAMQVGLTVTVQTSASAAVQTWSAIAARRMR